MAHGHPSHPLKNRVLALAALACASTAVAMPAAASATTYVQAPSTQVALDGISDGTANAPYNTSQGVTSYDTLTISPYPTADLFPGYSPAGQSSAGTPANSTTGASAEPNVAVYPGASGDEPFPSGFGGTPGPISGYCGASADDTWDTSSTAVSPNVTKTPVSQPVGTKLPFAPYYFPQIVRNADGSLTGYFDWRPKDTDEGTVVAKSTDGGLSWVAEGTALEQNPGYCPSADTNDDGEGHPYVATLGSAPDLYTLQRADGDTAGVGLLERPVNPTASNPLAGVPAAESVGVDPDTFATSATPVSVSTATSIPVSTLGGDATTGASTKISGPSGTGSGSASITVPDLNAITSGPFIDVTAEIANSLTPAQATVTCTGTSGATGLSPTLTGCTAPSSFTVAANDELEQVIGTINKITVDANSKASTTTIPYTANPTQASSTATAPGGANVSGTFGTDLALNNASANSPTTLYQVNANAPNRFYIDGSTVYCTQANADPVTSIEGCTTTNPNGLTVAKGDAVIADPTQPAAGKNDTGGPVTQTNGLTAPDGIIGALPASSNATWGAPANSKVVLYTEKLVNYFNIGGVNGTVSGPNGTVSGTATVTLPGSTPTDYNISPFPTESETLPATGSFTINVIPNAAKGTTAGFVALTCTGWDVDSVNANRFTSVNGTIDLLNCTGGTTSQVIAAGHQGQWIAGPGAAIEPYSVLSPIGEGKANSEKLNGNNEDYEVIRAAWTVDGQQFTDLGAISGSSSGQGATNGGYTDISNPFQQDSPAGPTSGTLDSANPQGDAPASLPIGSSDSVELRWPGARGTLVTNADGSLGLFLSGAWGSDGDSDAFNQIFYTQSKDGGKTWSVPTVVQSTDYSFSASVAQDSALAAGAASAPLGVSAYFSGRAYDPTVVQNPNGALTLVFAGYRLPSPVKAAGTALGTNTTAQYSEEETLPGGTVQTDPALYRDILTETLWPQQAPTVTTGSASGVTSATATVGGTVQTFENATSAKVLWGTSATSLTNTASAGSLSASGSAQTVSASLSGLSASTTYYYEVQGTDADGTGTGTVQSFTTAAAPAQAFVAPIVALYPSFDSDSYYTSSAVTRINIQLGFNAQVSAFHFAWQPGISFGAHHSQYFIAHEVQLYNEQPSFTKVGTSLTNISSQHDAVDFATTSSTLYPGKGAMNDFDVHINVAHLSASAAVQRSIKAHHIAHIYGYLTIPGTNFRLRINVPAKYA